MLPKDLYLSSGPFPPFAGTMPPLHVRYEKL